MQYRNKYRGQGKVCTLPPEASAPVALQSRIWPSTCICFLPVQLKLATRREFLPLSPHQTRRNLSTNRFLSPATVYPQLLHFHMIRPHFACWFRDKAAFGQFQTRCSMLTRCPRETEKTNTSNVTQKTDFKGRLAINFSIQCAVPRTQQYESGKTKILARKAGV